MSEQEAFEKWCKDYFPNPIWIDAQCETELLDCFGAGYQACAEQKDKHKHEILGALLIGLDAAKEVAANYHQTMAGYRENQHKMLDDDVICIEKAIAFLTGESE